MKLPLDVEAEKESSTGVITIEKISGDEVSNNHWNVPIKIVHNNARYGRTMLKLAGVICGCGLAQIKGVTEFSAEELKDVVVAIKKYCKEMPEEFYAGSSGIGAVIATLGSSYYSTYHDRLVSAGFKQVSQFKNWAHKDCDHTQRLYILEID